MRVILCGWVACCSGYGRWWVVVAWWWWWCISSVSLSGPNSWRTGEAVNEVLTDVDLMFREKECEYVDLILPSQLPQPFILSLHVCSVFFSVDALCPRLNDPLFSFGSALFLASLLLWCSFKTLFVVLICSPSDHLF